ncbi:MULTISPECIES: response regulator transcription factor [Paracoccus]|uniref:Response regulator n=1 Tax=Paracoccus litorisediminis TaxID=2006130 RepID=A0A844HKA7_9RHOB|nr:MULTISPECIES: response regulator transcription factor [Paracoccus]MBD9528621.1 response regulator transcription factor [Paracoccus sp. PAR01]MTH60623.1 response regulator [Paracoccus litorisediminis]
MRLLVIEDEADLATAVRDHLCAAGHAVDIAVSRDLAEAALQGTGFDLILLDLQLPDGDGLALLRWLRQRGDATPVLIATARDRITERIAGLQAGADDYLVKPYDLDEMLARIAAIRRRSDGRAEPERRFGPLRLLPERKQALLEDVTIHLTAREWALLERLSRRPGVIVSRQELEDTLYEFGAEVESNAIEAHISRLRAKLGRAVVETVRGMGYRMGQA